MMESLTTIDESLSSDRHLVAVSCIPSQKKILTQSPIALQTFQESRAIICDACLKPLIQQFHCSLCNKKIYCSVQCMGKDKLYHQPVECKVLNNIYENKVNPNTLFLISLRLYIQYGNDLKDSPLAKFKDNFQLLDEEKKAFVLQKSVVLMKYLNQVDDKQFSIKEESREMIAMIICQVMCNSFTIEDEFSQQKQALAVYPLINFINHSCEPNCIQVFSENILKIYSLQKIEEGEPLTISYIDNLYNRKERRAFLMDNYLFHCNCNKCQRETDQQEIKCKCGEFIITSGNLSCQKCELVYSSELFSGMLKKVVKNKDYIMNEMVESSMIIDKKIEAYSFIFDNLGSKNYFHIQSLQYLILDLLSHEHFEKALKYLIRLVNVLEKVINNNSPLLGWKYCEIAKLTFYLKKSQKSKVYSEKSIRILEIYYDSNNEQFRQLNERYRYIAEIMNDQEKEKGKLMRIEE